MASSKNNFTKNAEDINFHDHVLKLHTFKVTTSVNHIFQGLMNEDTNLQWIIFSSKILIDAGEENNAEFLKNLQQTLKDNGWGIQEILITHWHRDHAGGIEAICKMVPNGKFR